MIDIPPLRIPPCLVPDCSFSWYAVVTLLPIPLYCTSLLQRRQAIVNFQTALRKINYKLGGSYSSKSPISQSKTVHSLAKTSISSLEILLLQ